MKLNVDPDLLRRWREAMPPDTVLVVVSDETSGSLGPTPEEFRRRMDFLWDNYFQADFDGRS